MFRNAYRVLKRVANKSQTAAYFVWWFFFGPMLIAIDYIVDYINGTHFQYFIGLVIAWAIAVFIVLHMRRSE